VLVPVAAVVLGANPVVSSLQPGHLDLIRTLILPAVMVWTAARRTQAIQREASAAKVVCTDTALRVCARAMDLLGNHAPAFVRGARRNVRYLEPAPGLRATAWL
jgi:alkylation response protein AidB-like acyl-CoA dehydrogenase